MFYPQVNTDEPYPLQVCTECTKEITRCYNFKQKCEQNEIVLNKLITKLESDINSDFDNTEPFEPIKATNLDPINSLESCNICGKNFTRKDYLRKHLKRHHVSAKQSEKLNCHICGKLVLRLKRHMKTVHSKNKPFKCTECNQSYQFKCYLVQHVNEKHLGEKRKRVSHLCVLCGKTVNSSTAMVYHMRVHNDENPFRCNFCPKKFNSSAHLKVHERSHTGEKPYKCEMCEKSFSTSNILKKHVRTHTGERPYKCQICGKAFAQSGVLKTHMVVHKTF